MSVTNIKWVSADRLVTINQTDSTILIWNRKVPLVDRKSDHDSDETDSDDLEDGLLLISMRTNYSVFKTNFFFCI